MTVTYTDLWAAYCAARAQANECARFAGVCLRNLATRPGLLQYAAGDVLLDAYAADLEAEQIYREYSALMDEKVAA